MRPLLLPGPARRRRATTRPTAGPGVALFESAHVYRAVRAADDVARRPRPSAARRRPPSATTSAALLTVAAPGGWRSRRAGGLLLGARRCSAAALDGIAGVAWRPEPGERPVPAPRPRGHRAGRRRARARLARRAAPARGSRLGPARGRWPPSRSTSTCWPSWRRSVRRLPRRHELPGRAPGHRGGGARGRARAPRWRRRCRAGRRPARARLALFDVYRGEQVGEGKKSLALRLEFRAPDRTLTDEEVAEPRQRDRARAGRAGRGAPCLTGRIPWPSSAARPASAGALCAALVHRHPSLELTARHRAQRRRPAPRRALPALPACRWCSRSSTPIAWPRRADAALVAYPHGAPRRR